MKQTNKVPSSRGEHHLARFIELNKTQMKKGDKQIIKCTTKRGGKHEAR